MGTTAEKLTYLNGTKRLLRRRLNSLGAEITLETKFRDYLLWLDRFYKAASASVKFEILGETTQEQHTSLNLLPNDVQSQTINGVTITRNDDGSLVLNGTATTLTNIMIKDNFELSAGTYYFNFYDTTVPTYFSCNYDINGTTYSIWQNEARTFSNDTVGQVYINIPETVSFNNFVIHPMISEGSTKQDYEPYGTKPSPDNPSPIVNKTGNIIYEASDGTEFPVSLGDIELCGNPNPNGKPDRIYYENGQFWLEKNVETSLLEGKSEEGWYYKNEYNIYHGSNFDRSDYPESFNSVYVISNYFKNVPNPNIVDYSTADANLKNGEFAVLPQSSTLYLRYSGLDDGTSIDTAENFKNWISTHNVALQYDMKEGEYDPTLISKEEYPTLYAQLQAIVDYETKLQIEKKIF